ncbi:MAG: hypothetical protein ACP5P3_08585 [Ignavibacteria bacterium]
MKKISFLFLSLMLIISTEFIFAQDTVRPINYDVIKVGSNLLGPTVGLWANGINLTLGGNYEYELREFGPGVLGIGGLIRFWAQSDDVAGVKIEFKNTTLAAQANYNFTNLPYENWVPFIGIVLGYNSVSFKSTYSNIGSIGSGLIMWGQAGLRYFIKPNLALVARFGAGNNDFIVPEVGVDFKF